MSWLSEGGGADVMTWISHIAGVRRKAQAWQQNKEDHVTIKFVRHAILLVRHAMGPGPRLATSFKYNICRIVLFNSIEPLTHDKECREMGRLH
jgi:hypothetical protein